MNFYAEAPITSFFPRITTSKKRKLHTEPASGSSKKRRGDHVSTDSRQGTKSRANEDEQECCNTLDNGTISIVHSPPVDGLITTGLAKGTPQQNSERHMPLLPSLNVTLQTPKINRLPSRKNRKVSLPTPPPTSEAQRLMELPTLSPLISRKSPDFLRIEKVPLPTPSTLGRSASHDNEHSVNERCRVVQGQASLSAIRPKRSDRSLKASVPVFIPSSQSQLMANSYSEDKRHSMPANAALSYRQLPWYEVPVQPSLPSRITLNRRNKGDSTSHDSQVSVSSSQSQFLSPLDEHDRPQPNSIASDPEFDIIPSSQSQEKELWISSDSEEGHQSTRSRKQALPQRALSDELFSVSILQTDWTDSSFDSEQPVQGIADIPRIANQGNDSATEFEPEAKKKDLCYQDQSLTPMQSQPHGFSQPSTADSASLNEDHRDSRNSQQLSQNLSLADQTFSFASFPLAVKEFQSMFGSDSESYPADFPMSLR